MPSRSVLVALAVLIAVAAAAAPASAAPACAKPGSRTIDKNTQIRVYETGRDPREQLWSCRRSTGRHWRLSVNYAEPATSSGDISRSYRDVVLVGRHVAWASTEFDDSCPPGTCPDYDRETHQAWVADAVARGAREIPGANLAEGVLVLSRHGGLAWASAVDDTGTHEIHASVRKGDDRILDSGPIDPRTLDIEITIISWMRGAEERFARLR